LEAFGRHSQRENKGFECATMDGVVLNREPKSCTAKDKIGTPPCTRPWIAGIDLPPQCGENDRCICVGWGGEAWRRKLSQPYGNLVLKRITDSRKRCRSSRGSCCRGARGSSRTARSQSRPAIAPIPATAPSPAGETLSVSCSPSAPQQRGPWHPLLHLNHGPLIWKSQEFSISAGVLVIKRRLHDRDT